MCFAVRFASGEPAAVCAVGEDDQRGARQQPRNGAQEVRLGLKGEPEKFGAFCAIGLDECGARFRAVVKRFACGVQHDGPQLFQERNQLRIEISGEGCRKGAGKQKGVRCGSGPAEQFFREVFRRKGGGVKPRKSRAVHFEHAARRSKHDVDAGGTGHTRQGVFNARLREFLLKWRGIVSAEETGKPDALAAQGEPARDVEPLAAHMRRFIGTLDDIARPRKFRQADGGVDGGREAKDGKHGGVPGRGRGRKRTLPSSGPAEWEGKRRAGGKMTRGGEQGKTKPTFTFDGKKAAQIMIMSGYDGTGEYNFPFWEENLVFALKLQKTAEDMFPGMTRPLYFGDFAYNMNVNNGSLLIEVGTDMNTLEEAKYTGELLGKVLAKVLQS